MRPVHLLPAVVVTFGLFALSATVRGDDPPPLPPVPEPKAVTLPVTRVVLFNAGVAYVQRAGTVDGDARLDLRFPEADINDLLKSLVLTDQDGGKVRAVTYDNRTPVEFTLKSFALDLTDNPTVGQLLHQARGEKVEVTDKVGGLTAGKVVSVEKPGGTPDPGEMLNLLTADGLQSVELRQAKKIKFANPTVQAEFHKALELLAASRGDSKKAVSVVFAGAGKRRVGVGYVTEAPLWKPTYRLTVDAAGAKLAGWAAVENTSDDDWVNVKVGLVAGRPLTFKMDLYDPLFVPRPLVEPELYASLRSPLYQGGLNPLGNMGAGVAQNPQAQPVLTGNNNLTTNGGTFNFANNTTLGLQQGGFGGGNGQFGNLGGQFGMQAFTLNGSNTAYLPRVPRGSVQDLYGQRLSYDEYLGRVRGGEAQKVPGKPEGRPAGPPAAVMAAVTAADNLGDLFEYVIPDPVSLPRQKSALLPIVSEAVTAGRVSIYNARVLGKYPLSGLKLTNTTKLHLAAGPVTVYDGDRYAGDARLPDVKPGETRLVSYAIDLGTEVVVRPDKTTTTLVTVKVADGYLVVTNREKRTTKYEVRNRNADARTVVVEHPVEAGWRVTAPAKADDRTRDFHRFEVSAKAGDLTTLDVTEETDATPTTGLQAAGESQLKYLAAQPGVKPAVKEVLVKLLALREALATARKSLDGEQAALKEIADEQDRLRKNLERVPPTSDAYKRYLKKFDDQETEIETRQAKAKELKADIAKQEAALKEYAEKVKAE